MAVKPSLFKRLKEIATDYEFDPRARHAIEMADVARKAGFRVNEDNAQRYAKKFMERYIPDRERMQEKAREVAEFNMKHDWLKSLYDKTEGSKDSPMHFSDWLKERERETHKGLWNYDRRMEFDPEVYQAHIPFYKPEENRWRSDNPIKRYHTTTRENLKSILKDGLKPRRKGGYQDVLEEDSPRRMRAVFTEVRGLRPDEEGFASYYGMNDWQSDQYLPIGNEVKLELEIPKDVYTNVRRLKDNEEVPYGHHRDRLLGVMDGGRTDMFKDKISPEYIKAIWTEGGNGGFKRHTVEDWIENH